MADIAGLDARRPSQLPAHASPSQPVTALTAATGNSTQSSSSRTRSLFRRPYDLPPPPLPRTHTPTRAPSVYFIACHCAELTNRHRPPQFAPGAKPFLRAHMCVCVCGSEPLMAARATARWRDQPSPPRELLSSGVTVCGVLLARWRFSPPGRSLKLGLIGCCRLPHLPFCLGGCNCLRSGAMRVRASWSIS